LRNKDEERNLKVAICDDALPDRCWLVRAVDRYFAQHEVDVSISAFDSGARLLEAGADFDLYLLDVVMPKMNGIELAAQIRRQNRRAPIVFITSSSSHAIEGYRVNATGYLLKPLSSEDFTNELTRLLKNDLLTCNQTVSVLSNRLELQLNVNHIVYAESVLHTVDVHMQNEESLRLYQRLDDFERCLAHYKRFCRCHKSFLVNLDFATGIEDNTFHMENGAAIPISRSSYKESKLAFYNNKVNWW